MLVGIGGFLPEAEDENLIQQWSLRVHGRTFACPELGTIVQWFLKPRVSITSALRADYRQIGFRSRQDHGAPRKSRIRSLLRSVRVRGIGRRDRRPRRAARFRWNRNRDPDWIIDRRSRAPASPANVLA
jgi:hypothetical protein